ncbi:hypothetical protein SAMN05216249_10759 [Acetitomaculum ruminis DSM 5522]|uniref:LPXTG-motif cell wall anchor domain-containing protein n=1 Tax=Acetitomaculum ruminis DSM 5522 TaxID=1120918 RepID=A0A1I0XP29_9FIRM|nr:hypothetical protein [Acetitomaculum ruminis]SFB02805.1 hypothetical protein SAMN05216249_10759 [Acetitomaculum ruminis DSM 5522]
MKKRLLVGVITVLAMSIGMIAAASSDNATVTFTEDGSIEYTGNAGQTSNGVFLGDEFLGIAPGETATQTIVLKNENSHDAKFFLSEETIQALEETNAASGGAYKLALTTGASIEKSTSVFDGIEGGYNSGENASTDGLAGIDGLEDYVFVAEIESGKSTNVYFTLTLNGEGMDSTNVTDYTNSLAELAFNFRVYYPDRLSPRREEVITPVEGEKKHVTKIKDVEVPLGGRTASAITGDPVKTVTIVALFTILIVSTAVVLVAMKKRKREQ